MDNAGAQLAKILNQLVLSVKCHVEQDMSTSKLDQGFPILELLTPAYSKTAPFGDPSQRAFNHPAPRRVPFFSGHRTRFKHGFAPSSAVFDVGDVAFLFNKVLDVSVVIAFVRTQMLFWLVGTFDYNRDNQVVCRPFVVFIGASHIHRQWGTPLINQQVQLGALFATIRLIILVIRFEGRFLEQS